MRFDRTASGVFNEGSPPRERLIIEVVPSHRAFLARLSSPSIRCRGAEAAVLDAETARALDRCAVELSC